MSEHHDATEHEAHHLTTFREQKDAYMGSSRHSPFSHEQQHAFTGLKYFPHNPQLVFRVPLEPATDTSPYTVQTSTGESVEFRTAGTVQFEVEGQLVRLTVYRDSEDQLFVPLRDATSGGETYGAGRYLDPEADETGEVTLDFNYLYNPYCAYNDAWSCPLPPRENWLGVPIRAGELVFPG